MELSAHNVRRILASNFSDFLTHATRCRNYPQEIGIESFQGHEVRCVSQANFAFQIGAIESVTYVDLRNLAQSVTDMVSQLHKIYKPANYANAGVHRRNDAKENVMAAVSNLRRAIDLLKHDGVAHTILTTA